MLTHARTALKFFTYGLLAGLLFAPKSGKETRADALAWISRTAKETMGGGE